MDENAINRIDYKIHFFVHNEVYLLQSFKTKLFLQTDVREKIATEYFSRSNECEMNAFNDYIPNRVHF